MFRGIVLFAHGSRDPRWHRPVEAVAQRVRERAPDTLVVCAYLEMTSPDLAKAVRDLVVQGVQSITVVPMFLGGGKHAREDLPVLLDQLALAYPGLELSLQVAVGENPRLLDLLAEIALE